MKENKMFTTFALSLYNTNISLEQREKYIIDIINIYKLYTKYEKITESSQKFFLNAVKWNIYNKIKNLIFHFHMYDENLLEELTTTIINFSI